MARKRTICRWHCAPFCTPWAFPSAPAESFIKLYFSHPGDSPSFWQELEKHADLKPHIAALQFALQADLLTSGHLQLLEALVKMPGVKSMPDLARLDDSVWEGLVAKTGAPHHIPGAAPQAQAKLYVSSILATLHAAFPTLIVQRIAAASHKVDPLAANFLENSADFDIRTTRVDVYADSSRSMTAFKGIAEPKRAGVLKEVKRLQRLFAVSPNSSIFRALLETKFDSAHAIATIPRATFVSHQGHVFGGAEPAGELHERAQFINARNLHLRVSIHDAVKTPPTRALGHHTHAATLRTYAGHRPQASQPAAGSKTANHLQLKEGSLKEDLVKAIPQLRPSSFGSLSLCNCEECQSAIGPAAYLVDVLDFLGTAKPNPHGATPLDVLIGNPEKQLRGRRPDLAFMPLTCANTKTALPYIDIVNEIIESCVALGLKLDESSAHDTAEATTAELDANPQYVNQRAYGMLDKAVYPFTLPFNRPLLVARSYLNQLGASRYDVLHTFHKDQSSPEVKRILAAEYLGLTAEEFAILTGHDLESGKKAPVRPISEYYGYQGGASKIQDGHSHPGHWIADLTNAGTFLQCTGISFAELRALVATRFISPQQPAGAARELLQRIPVSFSSLAELLKSGLAHPVEAMVAIALAGITAKDLEALSRDNFEKIRKMVVVDDAGGTCDPGTMKLAHFDGSAINEQALDRMQLLSGCIGRWDGQSLTWTGPSMRWARPTSPQNLLSISRTSGISRRSITLKMFRSCWLYGRRLKARGRIRFTGACF